MIRRREVDGWVRGGSRDARLGVGREMGERVGRPGTIDVFPEKEELGR